MSAQGSRPTVGAIIQDGDKYFKITKTGRSQRWLVDGPDGRPCWSDKAPENQPVQ